MKFQVSGRFAVLSYQPVIHAAYEIGVINAYKRANLASENTRDSVICDATITSSGIVYAIYGDGEIIKSCVHDEDFVERDWNPFSYAEELGHLAIESATTPDGSTVIAVLNPGGYCHVFQDGDEVRFAARDYNRISISPDGKYIAVWDMVPHNKPIYPINVRVYSTETWQFVAQYDTAALYDVQFSQCSEYLLLSELRSEGGKARLVVEGISDPTYTRSWLTPSRYPLEVCDLGSLGVLVAPSEKPEDSHPLETKPLALLPPLADWPRDDWPSVRYYSVRYYPREVVSPKYPLHSLQVGILGKNKAPVVYGMAGESIVKVGQSFGDRFVPDFTYLEVIQ